MGEEMKLKIIIIAIILLCSSTLYSIPDKLLYKIPHNMIHDEDIYVPYKNYKMRVECVGGIQWIIMKDRGSDIVMNIEPFTGMNGKLKRCK